MSYTESFQFDAFTGSSTKSLPLFDLDLSSKFSSPAVNEGSARYRNISAGKVNGMYVAYTNGKETLKSDLPMQDPSSDMVGTRCGVTVEAIGTQANTGNTDYAVDTPFKLDIKFRSVDRVIDSMTDQQLEDFLGIAVSALYDKSGRFILRDLINGSLTRATEV